MRLRGQPPRHGARGFDFIAAYVASRDDLRDSEAVKVRLGRMDAQLFAARSALRCHRCHGSTAATTPTSARPTRCGRCTWRRTRCCTSRIEGFDIVGARAAHERYPLGQMMRDARTFTLHFRDDLYVQRLADLAMGMGFSAKKARSGSTPFDQSARWSVRWQTRHRIVDRHLLDRLDLGQGAASSPSTSPAARRTWGCDEVELVESRPGRPSVGARLRGSGGGRSLVLNGHLDIYELSEDWTRDPFAPPSRTARCTALASPT